MLSGFCRNAIIATNRGESQMKTTIILMMCMVTTLLSAISINEITTSGLYLYGRGEAADFDSADQKALKDLVSQISVQVKASYVDIFTEDDGNIDQFSRSMVETYSNTGLRDALREVDTTSKTGKTLIYRYIAKADLGKVFTSRERKIKEYARNGYLAEQELRLGDALRNYYWALLLLRTHPDHNTMCFAWQENSKECLLLTQLPEQINRLLANLKITLASVTAMPEENAQLIKLEVKSGNQPVQNIDLAYYQGNGWSSPTGGRDGICAFELNSNDLPKELQTRVEYRYAAMRNIDSEIRDALELSSMAFPAAEYRLKLRKPDASEYKSPEVKLSVPIPPTAITPDQPTLNPQPYLATTRQIIQAIKSKQLTTARDCFTDQGFTDFQQIVGYGKGQLLEKDLQLSVTENNGEVTVRELPMLFRFANNHRQFVEKLVLVYNSAGKVDAVTFALGSKATQDIRSKANWTPANQEQLIRFMEYYKTAYCLKDIGFIENVFADNALIIVGRVLKPNSTSLDQMYQKLGDKVQYVRQDKQTYIKNLKECFRSNEYINLTFEESSIKKVNGDERIYGIQIAQNWYSSSYSDQGHLFLMLDLTDEQNPKIYVRSWQPEKNPDGTIIGLKDFQME